MSQSFIIFRNARVYVHWLLSKLFQQIPGQGTDIFPVKSFTFSVANSGVTSSFKFEVKAKKYAPIFAPAHTQVPC